MTGIHPHTKPPLLPRRQGKGLDMTASEGLLEAVDEFEHLVTQTDGITVALEDHTVKPKSVIRIKTYHFLMTAIRKTVLYMLDS